MKAKIANLTKMYTDVKNATEARNNALQETLDVSEDFWSGLDGVKETIQDVQGTLDINDRPALDPDRIKQQQEELEVRLISSRMC